MITIEELKEVLDTVDSETFERFVHNCEELPRMIHGIDHLLIHSDRPSDFLRHVFHWQDSREGHRYWEHVRGVLYDMENS